MLLLSLRRHSHYYKKLLNYLCKPGWINFPRVLGGGIVCSYIRWHDKKKKNGRTRLRRTSMLPCLQGVCVVHQQRQLNTINITNTKINLTGH